MDQEHPTTLCWRCSRIYPFMAAACPFCSASNSNVDHGKAIAELAKDIALDAAKFAGWVYQDKSKP